MPSPPTGAPLSGSTNGLAISVTATSTPGTTIHTAVTGTSAFDALYIYATNVTGSAATLTIEWGGTGTANHMVSSYSIPANSPPVPIATGQRINNAKVVAAFSETTAAINVTGYYNRFYL